MKFICEWKLRNGEAFQAVSQRTEESGEPLSGIKYLAKWYDGVGGGYSLLETEDSQALNKLLWYWADLIDMRVVPVVEEENLPGV